MLKAFEKWLTDKESVFRQQGLTITISHSPTDIDKPSIRVDIDSDSYMGRIVIWNTGECQTEIVDIETEETLMDNYQVISAPSEFDNLLNPFWKKMNLPPFDSVPTPKEAENVCEFKFDHLTIRLATTKEIKENHSKSAHEHCLYFKEPMDMLFFLSKNKLLKLDSQVSPKELLSDALKSYAGKVFLL